jgi:hypothetical protein
MYARVVFILHDQGALFKKIDMTFPHKKGLIFFLSRRFRYHPSLKRSRVKTWLLDYAKFRIESYLLLGFTDRTKTEFDR